MSIPMSVPLGVFKKRRLECSSYLLLLAGFFSFPCLAATAPFDLSSLPDPNSLISPTITSALIKTIGLVFDHRAYEPATPLGTQVGLNLSVEATLVKVPEDFNQAMASIGSGGGAGIPFLPSPKINLHKGFGKKTDFGFSFISYAGYLIYGLELKTLLVDAEEGPVWAIRLSYTATKLKLSQSGIEFVLKTKTITPQILVSKRIEFADPYIGIGYQSASGSLDLTVPLPAPLSGSVSATAKGGGGAFMSFLGLGLIPPNAGFKLTLEGSYNTAKAHTLGTKFGFHF